MTTINVRGIPEAKELLDDLSGQELQNRVRRGTRAGAAVFREDVRREARSRADIPNSFAKTATRGHRNPVGTSTGPISPLLSIFEGGATSHPIGEPGQPLTNAKDLHGDDAFFARGPVHHPGMAARPLIGPIFQRDEGEATEAAMDALLEGIR